MKLSEAFGIALEDIKSGDESYICVALMQKAIPDETVQRAKKIIQERMGAKYKYVALREWVVGNGIHPNPTYSDMRDFRIRWLNALIKEFKAKGD